MKIIESKIVGKKSQEACEDGMVITDDFIAVIDGSTSKTPKHLNPDMKNGRYAMMLISEYIREELKADASVDEFCQGVTAYIYNKVYEKLGVEERLKEHPEERLTASALAEQIANDPQNIHSFIATKGIVEGNKSFDDRTYIRFIYWQ